MNTEKFVGKQRQRRSLRTRRHLKGKNRTVTRPRLSVFRSHKHIYAQIIDDESHKTVAAASTSEKDVLGGLKYGGNKNAAAAVGKAIAQRATAAGIREVSFDRGSYKYHGRIAALADAARESGLKF